MQNYHTGLVWKIDTVLIMALFFLSLFIIFYLFMQDFMLAVRRRRLLNLKKDIYKMLLAGNKDISPDAFGKLQTQEFLDVLTSRSKWAVFFNESEQEFFRRSFINQKNILKIERVARTSRNKWRRIEAMLALGFSDASSALAVFERGLFDKDSDISYFSLLALGRIRTELSLKILLSFLKKNALRRHKVASILENFPVSGADEIIKLANEQDPAVRFWALRIISRFHPEKYFYKIESLTHDQDPGVRAAACECLGNISTEEAQKVLARCLKDSSWLVRSGALKGLDNAMGEACLKYAAGSLSDNSLNVVDAAKVILGRHIISALPYLEKILAADDQLAKKSCVEILATSGHIEEILKEILAKDSAIGSPEMKLMASLVKSGAHYSIESTILLLPAGDLRVMLEKMRQINDEFAEHIRQKAQGLVKEI